MTKKRFGGFLFKGRYRRTILALFDMCCFAVVDFLYYILSDEVSYSTPVHDVEIYLGNSLCLFLCIFAVRLLMCVYSTVWRYTNTVAYMRMIVADFVGCVVSCIFCRFVITAFVSDFYIGIWHGVTVAALSLLLGLFARFTYRLIYKRYHKSTADQSAKIPVGIVGAGQLGAYLANELANSPRLHCRPVCFLDVDTNKIGNRVAGLPVYSEEDAEKIVRKYGLAEIIFTVGGLTNERAEDLWNRYASLGCKVKTYDSPFREDGGEMPSKKRIVRDFVIEDLLFRKPLNVGDQAEFSCYSGKTVLITGGGGSIGSELCRQIAKCSPKKLIIFDIYENNAYEIEQELIRKYGRALDLSVEIGSVRDVERLECIFKHYRPEIVFHAAAHKHVPLMEHSAGEAVKNNVVGTYNTANVAEKYGVKKFILISTDKAVNPTNVMGATKRVCEMIVQCRHDSKTSFAAVRFGNVLGSNGSVIPLFKRQINAGGPVTITDKRIIRYFMTIPEASQLVMLAGAKAEKGELFVLDMGHPVKIYDLAVNMIRLMGYTPDVDIEIKEIGLRPGEKLYEELLMKGETLIETDNKMIFVEKDTPYTRAEVDEKIAVLLAAVEADQDNPEASAVKEAIKSVVPTFVEPVTVNTAFTPPAMNVVELETADT
ncbi:MAG: polysaccharide biosynthesis protein [Clostridia bacterium]|nr:polysaccharide biosynthesis protein [Clostridia bacterium]